MKIAYEWIRIQVLWLKKQPLCQLCYDQSQAF